MPLRLLLDENVRGLLWHALLHHNSAGADAVDVTRVGDPPDLPLGTDDPPILAWAEREDRLLVCLDKSTMQAHLSDHLAARGHCPGIIVLRPRVPLRQLVEHLVLVCHASDASEWVDQMQFIP